MAHTAIKVRLAIANANLIWSHGPTYSQGDEGPRGTGLYDPSYDCSSFIGACWRVIVDGWAPDTTSMGYYYAQFGFDVFQRGDPAYGRLKQGDILVNTAAGNDGHTGMVYDKSGTIVILMSGSANGIRTNGLGFTAWSLVIRGSGGIRVVRWTGSIPWHIPGY